MKLSAPRPFSSWHSFFMHLAAGVFIGGVAGEIILTVKYGFTIYDGKKILLSSLNPAGVVFTAIRDYVVGAITAERGASGNIHFGTGPTYLGFIASFYWFLRGCPPLYVHSKSAVSDQSDGSASTETAETSEIDKRRRQLNDPDNSVATADRILEEPSADDYAIELSLFEAGDLDQSLWAKHLVEAEGDADKAKWKYLKERVGTAPVRRAEQHEAERKATEEAERRRREEEEAKQVAAEEAERKAAEEVEQKRAYRAAQANLQRLRDERAEKIGFALPVILVIAVLIVMLLTSI